MRISQHQEVDSEIRWRKSLRRGGPFVARPSLAMSVLSDHDYGEDVATYLLDVKRQRYHGIPSIYD